MPEDDSGQPQSIERCVGCFTHRLCEQWNDAWYCVQRCWAKKELIQRERKE